MKIYDQHVWERNVKTLQYEKEVVSFADVVNPEKIERLEIAFCNIIDLLGVTCLSNLREIHIHYCRLLRDISHIGDLQTLERINLFSLPKVEVNFSTERLLRLKKLSYTTMSGISSIRGIDKLTQLVELGLSRVKVIDRDYTPIVRSISLKRVFWVGAPFPSPALQELRKLRPDIIIGGNAYNEQYQDQE